MAGSRQHAARRKQSLRALPPAYARPSAGTHTGPPWAPGHLGTLPRQAWRGACRHPMHQLQPRPHMAARQLRSRHRASLPAGRRGRGRRRRRRRRAAHAHSPGQFGGGGRRRLDAGQPALQLCLPGRPAPQGDHAHLLPVAVELRAVPPARLREEPNPIRNPNPNPNPNPT